MKLAVVLVGLVLGAPVLGAALPGLPPPAKVDVVPGVQADADPLALAHGILAAETWSQMVLAVPDLQCSGLQEMRHQSDSSVADLVGSIYQRAGLPFSDADRAETAARAAALPDNVEQALQQLLGASDFYFAEWQAVMSKLNEKELQQLVASSESGEPLAKRIAAKVDVCRLRQASLVVLGEVEAVVPLLQQPQTDAVGCYPWECPSTWPNECTALIQSLHCRVDPFGLVQIGGSGPNTYKGSTGLTSYNVLTLDLGGEDTYYNEPGSALFTSTVGTSNKVPVGIALDLGGNDRYDPTRVAGGGIARASGGAVGLLADLGGDDEYVGSSFSLSASMSSASSFLIDAAGDDIYRARSSSVAFASGIGEAFFLDAHGNDKYVAEQLSFGAAFNQGRAATLDLGGIDSVEATFGGIPVPKTQGWSLDNSVAVFLNRGGADTYVAGAESQGHQSGLPGISAFFDLCNMDTYISASGGGNDNVWPSGLFGVGVDQNAGPGCPV